MKRWYTVKVKYNKKVQKNNGEEALKKVNESYLIPAVSFTDAETIINKEVGKSATGEFLVHAMSVTDVMDIFRYEDSGYWYMCKITIEYQDDKGNISKEKQNYMVEASSVDEANRRLEERLSDAMFSYKTTNVSLSKIIDVFHPNLDVEISRTPA